MNIKNIIEHKKILLLMVLIIFQISINALAPESIIDEIKKTSSGKSVDDVFASYNPRIIDLSKWYNFPSHKEKYQSILLINAHKKSNNNTLLRTIKNQIEIFRETIKSPINPKYEYLYVLLEQLRARFSSLYVSNDHETFDMKIANKIRQYLSDRGYSFWKLKRISTFHLDYLLQELIKNAYVYGNFLDMEKSVFVSWDVDEYDTFYLKIGDHSPATLINENGMNKIVFNNNNVGSDFNEKLSIAKDALVRASTGGITNIQSINNQRWRFNIELIYDMEGNSIGKFVVFKTNLRNEKKGDFSFLNRIKSIYSNFLHTYA